LHKGVQAQNAGGMKSAKQFSAYKFVRQQEKELKRRGAYMLKGMNKALVSYMARAVKSDETRQMMKQLVEYDKRRRDKQLKQKASEQ